MSLGSGVIHAIPGFFQEPDIALFAALLDATARHPGGAVAELGAYLGKSAVLLGAHLHGASLTVVDLFGAPADDERNAGENAHEYPDLTRRAFEANYLSVHPALPMVIQGLSHTVVDHVAPGSHRFVHVDASHTYEPVRADISAVRTILAPDGIVVFDDYRQFHTPGVAAAVWGAVATEGLRPFALTESKLYATWGDARAWADQVATWAGATGHIISHEPVAHQDVIRVRTPAGARFGDHPAKRFLPPVVWPAAAAARARLQPLVAKVRDAADTRRHR